MRYAIPFSMTVFDSLVVKYSLSRSQRYYLEKFSQLDSSILRSFNFTQLAALYNDNRQTVTSAINSLCKENLLLDTKIGFIVSIPTYTGFLGIFTGEYNGIYKFVFHIPKTQITYSIDIFKDNIEELALSKLEVNKYYYLIGRIKNDEENYFLKLLDDKQYHISFFCKKLEDCYLLEEIGIGNNNPLLFSSNKGSNL
jgi:hypothetical protein